MHELPKVVHNALISRIKTLARLDIAEKRRPQDGRIKIAHRDIEVELRISTMPTAFGESTRRLTIAKTWTPPRKRPDR